MSRLNRLCMSEFERASAVSFVREGLFRALIPDGWQQGRGAFGGLVLGTLARAIIAAEGEPQRRLRALTGDVCAPVLPGEVEIEVQVLRRGSHLSNLDARLKQRGAIVARASAALGTARAVHAAPRAPAPPAPSDWTQVAHIPVAAPFGPVFAQHYEYRTAGPIPLSGGSAATTQGFVREVGRDSALDAPAVIALLDAFWPSLYSIETRPRALATVSFSAELFADPSLVPAGEPVQQRAELVALQDGFLTEFRELWSGPSLIALGQQTMSLLT